MSNTTNEPVFHYTLHKRLWNILADNPGMDKYEALVRFFTVEEIKEFGLSKCTACEYTKKVIKYGEFFCAHCPLDDSNVQTDPLSGVSISCFKGVYRAWHLTMKSKHGIDDLLFHAVFNYTIDETYAIMDHTGMNQPDEIVVKERLKELCSQYARTIANLPVKNGVKYI